MTEEKLNLIIAHARPTMALFLSMSKDLGFKMNRTNMDNLR